MHSVQEDCPVSGCICPAGHGAQDGEDAAELEKEPIGHVPSGCVRPAVEQKLPAVQGLQENWPWRS